MIDFEKSEKLPPERRYFNISIIWIFYFRWVIRLLYYLRIPHELVTLLSIGFGMLAAWLFLQGQLIVAAAALHLKDIFDASDGALARLTGRGHLIGRYLDSLGDFLALTLVMGVIAWQAADSGETLYFFLGGLAILSTFIQCSFFNYYQLKYVETFGITTLSSRTDENRREDIADIFSSIASRMILSTLRFFYKIVYSWQDSLVRQVDRQLFSGSTVDSLERYGNKKLMVMQSALCFGTHIFVIILFTLFGYPEYALIFISLAMNFYLLILLYLRKRHYRRIGPGKTKELINGMTGARK